MSSLQLPGVAPSKDIRHFFPTLDAEQLAAKRRKDALQEQLDAAADVEGSAARAAAAAARKKPVGRPRKEQELQACDDADGTAAAPGAGAAGAAVAGRRGPYTDWFPPGLFDPILEQVRAEPRPRVCDASRGLLLPSSLSCVWSRCPCTGTIRRRWWFCGARHATAGSTRAPCGGGTSRVASQS